MCGLSGKILDIYSTFYKGMVALQVDVFLNKNGYILCAFSVYMLLRSTNLALSFLESILAGLTIRMKKVLDEPEQCHSQPAKQSK